MRKFPASLIKKMKMLTVYSIICFKKEDAVNFCTRYEQRQQVYMNRP